MRENVPPTEERNARLDALDAMIERALSDIEQGRVRPLKAVFDRLEAKFKGLTR